MDAQTWDRQPYWAQRIYVEGLLTEKPWETKLDMDSGDSWSPLNSEWETFGDLPLDLDADTAEQSPDEQLDTTNEEQWNKLPGPEAFGAHIRYANTNPKLSESDN